MLLAYTGPAELGKLGQKTDIWIAKTLKELPPNINLYSVIDHIKNKLFVDISKYRDDIYKYITIIATGWGQDASSGVFVPYMAVISTYLDGNLNQVPLSKVGNMTIVNSSLVTHRPHWRPFIFYAGQNISSDRKERLKNYFRHYDRGNLSQNIMLDALYQEIVIASQSNNWVGRGVLAAAISKESVVKGEYAQTIIASGDIGTGQQFLYYPANGNHSIYKGPHMVFPGEAIVDFGVRYLNSDKTDQEISIRYL